MSSSKYNLFNSGFINNVGAVLLVFSFVCIISWTFRPGILRERPYVLIGANTVYVPVAQRYEHIFSVKIPGRVSLNFPEHLQVVVRDTSLLKVLSANEEVEEVYPQDERNPAFLLSRMMAFQAKSIGTTWVVFMFREQSDSIQVLIHS